MYVSFHHCFTFAKIAQILFTCISKALHFRYTDDFLHY